MNLGTWAILPRRPAARSHEANRRRDAAPRPIAGTTGKPGDDAPHLRQPGQQLMQPLASFLSDKLLDGIAGPHTLLRRAGSRSLSALGCLLADTKLGFTPRQPRTLVEQNRPEPGAKAVARIIRCQPA